MKNKLIAEIGFNHFGSIDRTRTYLDSLTKHNLYGITFQIREPAHQVQKSFNYLNFSDFNIICEIIKDAGIKVGIALADKNKIAFFESLKVDFYKVIRNDITNYSLCKLLLQTKKPIYVSTGLSGMDSIANFMESHYTSNLDISLVHTQLSYKLEDCNLKCLDTLKDFNVPISYGHHCDSITALELALCFSPKAIFFYVKDNSTDDFPDNNHAITLNDVEPLIRHINKLNNAIGSGLKTPTEDLIKKSK